MTTVREGLEQAVLLSIGAAALTRERAEAAVAELVRKGQVGGEEGAAVVERLMARVRGEGVVGDRARRAARGRRPGRSCASSASSPAPSSRTSSCA